MTIGTHIVEVLRQGIWASLTGGWYYEPSHSSLCNIIHLYLWLLLFILPLLFGLIHDESANTLLISMYLGIVLFLFLFLKLFVFYLHNLFDTSEPISKSLKPSSKTMAVEVLSAGGKSHLDSDGIELIELKTNMNSVEGIIDGNRVQSSSTEHRLSNLDALDTIMKTVSHNSNEPECRFREQRGCYPDRSGIYSLSMDDYEATLSRARQYFIVSQNQRNNRVRRAKSAFETAYRNTDENEAMLSQNSLQECKRSTRKSYPSKMSSTAAFLSSTLVKRCASFVDVTFHRSSNDTVIDESAIRGNYGVDSTCSAEKLGKSYCSYEINSVPSNQIALKQEDALSADKLNASQEDCSKGTLDMQLGGKASSSVSGWNPVFVSLGDVDQPSTSRILDTTEHTNQQFDLIPTGCIPPKSDLKSEITKFLEELIDKHPETLDAIENVRMNRLGRMIPSGVSTSDVKFQYSESSNQAPFYRKTSFHSPRPNITFKDGTHIAVNHEDTSEGAIHSFQDEDGNWWTYAFNIDSGGIAYALGSSRTLLEIIEQNSMRLKKNLSALPENGSHSSKDSIKYPLYEQTGGSDLENSHRAPSSSTDSATYIADLPTAIFRTSSSVHAARLSDRDRPIVTFARVGTRWQTTGGRGSENSSIYGGKLLEESNSENTELESTRLSCLERYISDPGAVRSGRTVLEGPTISMQRIPFFSEISLGDVIVDESRRRSKEKRNQYYRLNIFSSDVQRKGIKIKMDRLSALALFDRNNSIYSSLFDVILAVVICILACTILSKAIFRDVFIVLFSLVVAGTHFSILKSVQPDASSPIHGYNWIVAYSRPLIFCVLCSMLLILDANWWDHRIADQAVGWLWNPYRIYSVSYPAIFATVRDSISAIILLLPIAFTLGMIPQANTLLLHVLEQIEMHIFGGTACFSLSSAFIQLSRSLISIFILSGLAHMAHQFDPGDTQNIMFSIFIAFAVAISHILSGCSSNPSVVKTSLQSFCVYSKSRRIFKAQSDKSSDMKSNNNIFPEETRQLIKFKTKQDIFVFIAVVLFSFALHCTSMFTVAQPVLQICLIILCVIFGILNHYIYNELRRATPWKLVTHPILRPHEFAQYESNLAAKLMPFEIVHYYMLIIEKNILYPLFVISTVSVNRWALHPYFLALFAQKLLRSSFCQPQIVYAPLAIASLLTRFDLVQIDRIDMYFPLILYANVLLWPKFIEFSLKMYFVLAYVAPWQISWGSAFHAFAQPFSMPHTAFIFMQTVLSSLASAPLNPFLGSSFFLTSYVRNVKFWEKDYNTKRVDHSNTRLISQIDRGPMLDDNNLNAVFYEHLTLSLQLSLAGDLILGRWSTSVQPGDCFILASYYLNCLLHIVEVGNGFVTFQLRGLEFRGTYCHQREVEAISEDLGEAAGFCCCSPGSLPGMLSLNRAWMLRWLAWEVVSTKYIVDGYSITDNSALNLLQVHELRRLLVTLYVKCMIFYALSTSKLSQWLQCATIMTAIRPIQSSHRPYVDLDPVFGSANDEDFDINLMGLSLHRFTEIYEPWILHCMHQGLSDYLLNEEMSSMMKRVTIFSFALSIVGRRTLATAAHNRHSNSAESFLYGLHALFQGDFRITCQRDEWVFADMDILRSVIAPAVRMALKLHQDHFAAGDDFDDPDLLYRRITRHLKNLFISHEHDPAWRRAIISNTPSLLALRHIYDDGQDDYKIIMLNKMCLNMRVIKVNRECVRSFWAGQQQELIFLRNRNPERGSIQNARQVLRNMINSSADQPVGYPIYVSPLTTSFAGTHPQIRSLIGPPVTPTSIGGALQLLWTRIRSHFGPSGSSNIPQSQGVGQNVSISIHEMPCVPTELCSSSKFIDVSSRDSFSNRKLSDGYSLSSAVSPENSLISIDAGGVTRVTLCSAKHRNSSDASAVESFIPPESSGKFAKIISIKQVFTSLNEPMKATGETLVVWPNALWQSLGGRSSWEQLPATGFRGKIVHIWVPFHPRRECRSHAGVIYLLCVKELKGCYVPVMESGIEFITEKDYST